MPGRLHKLFAGRPYPPAVRSAPQGLRLLPLRSSIRPKRAQKRLPPADKDAVGDLQDSAAALLDTAGNCIGGGDWTVFIGPEGGLQLIAGSDHSLESLASARGATSAWQVRRHAAAVRVEGISAGRRCVLEAPMPGLDARRLLPDVRLYALAAQGSPMSRRNCAASSGGVGLM